MGEVEESEAEGFVHLYACINSVGKLTWVILATQKQSVVFV